MQVDEADLKKGEAKPPPPTSISCVVMDGEVMDESQWKVLEKLPTKADLLTRLAVGLKANPRKLATSIKGVPRKLAAGVRALADLDDDKTLTVAEAVAKKSG